ncbi:hypothetical protein Tco_0865700 [Tanacetum coccineum]
MSNQKRELPVSSRRRSKRHIQEVVSAADNREVVKQTQLLDSHERNKKGTLLSDCPPVIGNYLKEIQLALGRGSRAMGPVDLVFQAEACRLAISNPYYCNLPTPNDLRDWIFKDITHPVGWANVETVFGQGGLSLVDLPSATDEQTTTEGHVKAWCLQAKEHTSQGLYNHIYFSTSWTKTGWFIQRLWCLDLEFLRNCYLKEPKCLAFATEDYLNFMILLSNFMNALTSEMKYNFTSKSYVEFNSEFRLEVFDENLVDIDEEVYVPSESQELEVIHN